jgi:hypothetical protein
MPKRERRKFANIGDYHIRYPDGWELLEGRNLDLQRQSDPRPDYLLRFKVGRCIICILIEVTGIPEIDDIKRLEGWDRGCSLAIRIVHHRGGVRSPVLHMARRMRAVLVRCSSAKAIDLVDVWERYRLPTC